MLSPIIRAKYLAVPATLLSKGISHVHVMMTFTKNLGHIYFVEEVPPTLKKKKVMVVTFLGSHTEFWPLYLYHLPEARVGIDDHYPISPKCSVYIVATVGI